MKHHSFEVLIVGGGPAGLTCALVLGRCGRKVAVLDSGTQRNKASSHMHAFPTRDGEKPPEFLNQLKRELARYGIRVTRRLVTQAKRSPSGFRVVTNDGAIYESQLLLLATGLRDELPPLPGIEKYYGKGVFHCPYCDGWEHRDKPWVIWAKSSRSAEEICLRALTWTKDITLLTEHLSLGKTRKKVLERHGIKIVSGSVQAFQGKSGRLHSIKLQSGAIVPCSGLFFNNTRSQQSDLAISLGCEFTRYGQVKTGRLQQTCVKGVYSAGDMARDMELMVIAAAEGAKAAVAMNARLNERSRRQSL